MRPYRFFILIFALLLIGFVSGRAINFTSAQTTECPVDTFYDVSEGSAGDGYADPVLNISCTEDSIIIEANGIINYEYVAMGPGDLMEQNYRWVIPLNPEMAEETTAIPLLGPAAVAINGIPIFGPNEAPEDGTGDPYANEMLDFCNGHIGPGGVYHYHARPECLTDEEVAENNVGLILGYAFDGYPILAPYVCVDESCSEIIELQSSWQRTTDVENVWEAYEYVEGTGDLDECNGLPTEDGSYAYYATDTFPYLLSCYRGVVDPSLIQTPPMNGANNQQQGGQQPGGQPLAGSPPPPPPGGGPPPGGQPGGTPPPP